MNPHEKVLKLLEIKQPSETAEPFLLQYMFVGNGHPFTVMIFLTKDVPDWVTD